MCGIIGYIGPEKFNKDKIVTLMVYNQLKRGDDSTGIYTVDTGIIKSVLKADLFIEKEFPNLNEQTLFIGHVRKRTSGIINQENAHPFKYDDLIGVHNGSVTNTDELYEDWQKTFSVDSQVILYRLAIEKNPKVLQELDGGTAILVHRENEPNVIYGYNNGGRELYYGEGEKDSYYISSIKESLAVIGCKHIEEFKKETLYKIGIVDDKATILNSLKLKVEPKKKKVTTYNYSQAHMYNKPTTIKPNMLYFSDLINDDVKNIWVKYDGKDVGVLKQNNFYKIKEFDKTTRTADLVITNTSFTRVNVNDLDITSVQKLFTKDELVIVIGDLKNKTGELVLKKDQIVTVTHNEYNSKSKFIDVIDDKGNDWYLTYESVRSLTEKEKEKHLKKQEGTEETTMITHPILDNVLDNVEDNKLKTMITKYTGTTEERLEKLISYLELYTKAVQDVINDNQSIVIRGGFMAKHTSMLRIVDKFKDSSKLLESDINRLDTIMK